MTGAARERKRLPVRRIEETVAYCTKRVAEVQRRLEDLLETVPEDGPEGTLGFGLRGDVECLLMDDIQEAARKLARMLAAIGTARSEGWRGEREWLEKG